VCVMFCVCYDRVCVYVCMSVSTHFLYVYVVCFYCDDRVLHFGTRLLWTGNRAVQETIMDYHDKVSLRYI
jgi:hypothetical protein